MSARNSERNQRIVALVDAGFTIAAVGQFLGISRQRVHQIYRAMTGARTPKYGGRVKRDSHSIKVRRFWSGFRVDENGCWTWTRSLSPNEYGTAQLAGVKYAHRVAYTLVNGAIPAGLTIDHLCRNRACGNPAHLEVTTLRENVLRSPIQVAAINARKTHCVRGHAFSDENTYVAPDRSRTCRTCQRVAAKQKRAA